MYIYIYIECFMYSWICTVLYRCTYNKYIYIIIHPDIPSFLDICPNCCGSRFWTMNFPSDCFGLNQTILNTPKSKFNKTNLSHFHVTPLIKARFRLPLIQVSIHPIAQLLGPGLEKIGWPQSSMRRQRHVPRASNCRGWRLLINLQVRCANMEIWWKITTAS